MRGDAFKSASGAFKILAECFVRVVSAVLVAVTSVGESDTLVAVLTLELVRSRAVGWAVLFVAFV